MAFAPSLQKPYDICSPFDPAFAQLADDASEADAKAHAAMWALARERGDYAALLVEGQTPTVFTLQPLAGDVFRALSDLSGVIGPAELMALVLRAALVNVVNLPGVDGVKRIGKHPRIPGNIATVDAPNVLDANDPRIVAELANEVLRRAREGIAPRS